MSHNRKIRFTHKKCYSHKLLFFFISISDTANCSNIKCKDRQICLNDLITHRPRCVSCNFKCSRKRKPQVCFSICKNVLCGAKEKKRILIYFLFCSMYELINRFIHKSQFNYTNHRSFYLQNSKKILTFIQRRLIKHD